jgi:hypothetical protein
LERNHGTPLSRNPTGTDQAATGSKMLRTTIPKTSRIRCYKVIGLARRLETNRGLFQSRD